MATKYDEKYVVGVITEFDKSGYKEAVDKINSISKTISTINKTPVKIKFQMSNMTQFKATLKEINNTLVKLKDRRVKIDVEKEGVKKIKAQLQEIKDAYKELDQTTLKLDPTQVEKSIRSIKAKYKELQDMIKSGNIMNMLNDPSKRSQLLQQLPGISNKDLLNAQTALQQISDTLKPVVDGFKKMDNEAKKTTKTSEKLKKIISALPKPLRDVAKIFGSSGIAQGLGILAVTKFAGKFARAIKDTVKVGLELEGNLIELDNVINQTFDGEAATVTNWATSYADAMNLATNTTTRAVANIGSVLKGFLDESAFENLDEMSVALSEFAFDLASFKDIDFQRAANAVTSALTGITKPLQNLGIVVKETKLAEWWENLDETLTKGISWKDLDLSSKAVARFNYIMAATQDIQGDLARTMNTYANRVRQTKELHQEFASSIGNRLIPIATNLRAVYNGLLEALTPEKIPRTNAALIEAFTSLRDEMSKTYEETMRYYNIREELMKKYPELSKLIDAETASYEELLKAMDKIDRKRAQQAAERQLATELYRPEETMIPTAAAAGSAGVGTGTGTTTSYAPGYREVKTEEVLALEEASARDRAVKEKAREVLQEAISSGEKLTEEFVVGLLSTTNAMLPMEAQQASIENYDQIIKKLRELKVLEEAPADKSVEMDPKKKATVEEAALKKRSDAYVGLRKTEADIAGIGKTKLEQLELEREALRDIQEYYSGIEKSIEGITFNFQADDTKEAALQRSKSLDKEILANQESIKMEENRLALKAEDRKLERKHFEDQIAKQRAAITTLEQKLAITIDPEAKEDLITELGKANQELDNLLTKRKDVLDEERRIRKELNYNELEVARMRAEAIKGQLLTGEGTVEERSALATELMTLLKSIIPNLEKVFADTREEAESLMTGSALAAMTDFTDLFGQLGDVAEGDTEAMDELIRKIKEKLEITQAEIDQQQLMSDSLQSLGGVFNQFADMTQHLSPELSKAAKGAAQVSNALGIMIQSMLTLEQLKAAQEASQAASAATTAATAAATGNYILAAVNAVVAVLSLVGLAIGGKEDELNQTLMDQHREMMEETKKQTETMKEMAGAVSDMMQKQIEISAAFLTNRNLERGQRLAGTLLQARQAATFDDTFAYTGSREHRNEWWDRNVKGDETWTENLAGTFELSDVLGRDIDFGNLDDVRQAIEDLKATNFEAWVESQAGAMDNFTTDAGELIEQLEAQARVLEELEKRAGDFKKTAVIEGFAGISVIDKEKAMQQAKDQLEEIYTAAADEAGDVSMVVNGKIQKVNINSQEFQDLLESEAENALGDEDYQVTIMSDVQTRFAQVFSDGTTEGAESAGKALVSAFQPYFDALSQNLALALMGDQFSGLLENAEDVFGAFSTTLAEARAAGKDVSKAMNEALLDPAFAKMITELGMAFDDKEIANTNKMLADKLKEMYGVSDELLSALGLNTKELEKQNSINQVSGIRENLYRFVAQGADTEKLATDLAEALGKVSIENIIQLDGKELQRFVNEQINRNISTSSNLNNGGVF